MTILIAADTYQKEHVASFFSSSFFCCFATWLGIIFLPFLFCIATNNFWITIIDDSEQIQYDFRHEFVILSLENKVSKVFSNLENFDRDSPFQIQSPSIQSASLDINEDGYNDKFIMNIEFFADSLNLKQCQLILFFDVKLKQSTNVLMTGILVYNIQSKAGIQEANIFSRVNFKQRIPVPRSTTQQLFYRDNIFSTNNNDIIQTLLDYEMRDYTIQPEYDTVLLSGQSQKVKINLELYLDRQTKIYFKTSMLTLFKFAWIQYISLFIPIYFFMTYFLRFTYSSKLMYSQQKNNLPKNQRRF